MSNEITVILNGFRRPNNIESQLEILKSQSVRPTEIMLWGNYGGEGYEMPAFPGVKTTVCNTNFNCHARFAYALLAQTEFVCIMDDDLLPGRRWLENCLKTFNQKPGVIGFYGVILDPKAIQSMRVDETTAANITTHDWIKKDQEGVWINHEKINEDKKQETLNLETHTEGFLSKNQTIVEVDFVGGCWFLKREWLKYFWQEEPFARDNAEEIHFGHMLKKHANISSYVAPHPPDKPELWGTLDWNLQFDEHSYHMQNRGTFLKTRVLCIKNALENGWKVLNQA